MAKEKRTRLRITNAAEDVPRLIQGSGRTHRGGTWGLALRPHQRDGMLLLAPVTGKVLRWTGKPTTGGAPKMPTATSRDVDKDAAKLAELATPPTTARTPITLNGQWIGHMVCSDAGPELQLVRRLNNYVTLVVQSDGRKGTWLWELVRTERWFAQAGGKKGEDIHLFEAIGQALAAFEGVVGPACTVRDTRRRGSRDKGYKGRRGAVREAREAGRKADTVKLKPRKARTRKAASVASEAPGQPNLRSWSDVVRYIEGWLSEGGIPELNGRRHEMTVQIAKALKTGTHYDLIRPSQKVTTGVVASLLGLKGKARPRSEKAWRELFAGKNLMPGVSGRLPAVKKPPARSAKKSPAELALVYIGRLEQLFAKRGQIEATHHAQVGRELIADLRGWVGDGRWYGSLQDWTVPNSAMVTILQRMEDDGWFGTQDLFQLSQHRTQLAAALRRLADSRRGAAGATSAAKKPAAKKPAAKKPAAKKPAAKKPAAKKPAAKKPARARSPRKGTTSRGSTPLTRDEKNRVIASAVTAEVGNQLQMLWGGN